jgi:hypothetical protein
MLNNFVLPASISSGQAVEGVQPIQGFAPYNQLTELMSAFHLAEDGAKPEDEDKKGAEVETSESEPDEELPLPVAFDLALNVSFKEMLDYFLVPHQDKVLNIQTKFRNERNVDELTIFPPAGISTSEMRHFRDQLYEFQMQLFSTRKGVNYRITL